MSILAPDVLIPHAQEGVRKMGFGAAWGKIVIGQFFDFPVASFIPSTYEQIIRLKTMPLFEAAGTLGIRAGANAWLTNLGQKYGWTCGMAFQVYDDYTDIIKAVGQPWEAPATGSLPSSLRAVRTRVRGDGLVTDENCREIVSMGEEYLRAVSRP